MGEKPIKPILNVHDNYRKVNILNSFWASAPVDPLVNTFTPTGNQLWSNAANWSLGHVPTLTETADISGGDIILNVVTTINKLVIATGRTLTAQAPPYILTVNDNVTNNGTINFTGSAGGLVMKGLNNVMANYIAGTNSSMTYGGAGNQTIFGFTYCRLIISGTGIKDIGSANLNVTSTTSGNGTLAKTGAGTVTFGAAVTVSNIQFQVGNPTIEFKGGDIRLAGSSWNLGTGAMKISTISQTWKYLVSILTLNNPVTIEGNITWTLLTETTNQTIVILNGTVNGTVAGSTFKNAGTIRYNTAPSVLPMATGVFDITTDPLSIVEYLFNGNYTLPYSNYGGLKIGGTGIKTAGQNLTTEEILTINGGSKLELANYNLIAEKGTVLSSTGVLSKTGAGNILFIGAVTGDGGMQLTGNPTVEMRGGLRLAGATNSNFGAGQFSFTTNNQSVKFLVGTASVFNGPVVVVGAITITFESEGATPSYISFTGTIDGTVAGSVFENRCHILRYANAVAPMATFGTFNSSTIPAGASQVAMEYNGNGNQDVKGITYNRLTLTTNGVKKLLGNVSVVSVYTLIAPATLDTNGYTLTNP